MIARLYKDFRSIPDIECETGSEVDATRIIRTVDVRALKQPRGGLLKRFREMKFAGVIPAASDNVTSHDPSNLVAPDGVERERPNMGPAIDGSIRIHGLVGDPQTTVQVFEGQPRLRVEVVPTPQLKVIAAPEVALGARNDRGTPADVGIPLPGTQGRIKGAF